MAKTPTYEELEKKVRDLEQAEFEGKRAVEALRESEERFRTMADGTPPMIWVTDSKGHMEFVNAAYCRFFGTTLEEVQIWGWQPLLHPEDAPSYVGEYFASLKDQKPFKAKARVRRHDGEWRWVCSYGQPRFSPSGEFMGIAGSSPDITDHTRTEETLRESEGRLSAIFQSAQEAIITLDEAQRCLQANPGAGVITGVPHDQLIGRSLAEFVDPSFDLSSAWEDFVKTGRFEGEVPIRHSSGSFRIVEAFGTADIGSGRHLFVGHDITERKRMEEELRRSRDELEVRVQERTAELKKEIEKRARFSEILKESGKKLARQYQQRRYMAQKLVELLEQDRRDTAMTLHDEVGSILTGARIEIETIESEFAESPAADRIKKVKERLNEVMSKVRNISSQLRPSALDHFGLIPAITSLTEEVTKESGIRIHVHTSGMPKNVSREKELALYRIVQESLNNAVKHAEAREVFVTLSCRRGTIYLSVEDDGKGFSSDAGDENSSRLGHTGISIMRERATQFKGVLRVESSPGRGTEVMVEFPVSQAS